MKTIIREHGEACRLAADQIRQLVDLKPDARIALTAECALQGIWSELTKLYKSGKLSFAETHFFLLAEFSGSVKCRNAITDLFIEKIDVKNENCFFLDDKNVTVFDQLIDTLGGLDMAIVSIGSNGRIGFNDPATPFESVSHIQRLAPATRRELSESFGGEENVPEFGLTLGIKTITSAKNIIVAAFGAAQAKPVFNMLYGRNDSIVPAAFLQIPINVAVYLDHDAAQKL